MKKTIIFLLIIVLLINSSAVFAEENINEKGNTERYIVVSDNKEAFQNLVSNNKVRIAFERTNKNNSVISSADISSKNINEINNYTNDVHIEKDVCMFADTNRKLRKKSKKSDSLEKPWNIKMVNADQAFGTYNDDNHKKVKIGIIDSGVNFTRDLSLAGKVDFTSEDSYFLYEDMTGHGSSVAGIIGSNKKYGINENAEIYSIKVMNSDNTTSVSKVISGIYWAIENDINILNLSLGTTVYSEALELAINEAYNNGILIVASAGNSEKLNYPAAFDNVIAVGSIDNRGDIISKNLNLYEEIVFAPGENIISYGDFGGTLISSGTSMAAPHVTALASILWQKDLNLTNEFIKKLIFDTANTSINNTKIIDFDCAIKNYKQIANNFINNNDNVKIANVVNNKQIETFSDAEMNALWGTNQHNDLITYTFDNNDIKLTSSETALIKKICSEADTIYGIGKTKGVNALHGSANYVATFKYLYYFSKFVETADISTTSTSLSITIALADTYARSFIDFDRLSADERAKFFGQENNIGLVMGVKDLITRYGLSKNGKYIRNLIFGFILHLLGDTYAHRMIVQSYTVSSSPANKILSGGEINKKSRFGTNDFPTTNNSPYKSNYNQLKDLVNAQNIEFCSVANFTKMTDGKRNTGLYEDNYDFCYGRFVSAESTCYAFIDWYNDEGGYGFNLFTPEYGKLNNFKDYFYKAEGYSDCYTESEWNSISTLKIVLNQNVKR